LRSVGHIHRIQRLLGNDAEYVTAQDMLAELREDNKQLAGIPRQVHVTCEAYNDVATTGLLGSSLTRAVIFSAMTNAVAFGSMWSSSYPGISSMGKMMALALMCTMAAAVLFQPVLMGLPRQVGAAAPKGGDFVRDAAE
jgi:hypothetical protein